MRPYPVFCYFFIALLWPREMRNVWDDIAIGTSSFICSPLAHAYRHVSWNSKDEQTLTQHLCILSLISYCICCVHLQSGRGFVVVAHLSIKIRRQLFYNPSNWREYWFEKQSISTSSSRLTLFSRHILISATVRGQRGNCYSVTATMRLLRWSTTAI